MKVFLSWSGALSHKVALVFRDWLPGVIQEIVPYVSSEDIDKGARWSTDIAKELADSTFGILCVTRDNINAPWLAFEAGALSKTMDKAFVTPFLFNIKRSEVDGPLLQFQSTVFERDDLRKLVQTLNKACDSHALSPDRLSKAFEVWFPTLQSQLNKLQEAPTDSSEDHASDVKTPGTQDMLEEILELSRSNQKLIRNPDGSLASSIEEMTGLLRDLLARRAVGGPQFLGHRSKRAHPIMLQELLHASLPGQDRYLGVQIVLALVREDLPWIYDAGLETVRTLRSRRSRDEKHVAVSRFEHLVDFSFDSPIMREMHQVSGGAYAFLRELPYILHNAVDEPPAA